MTRIDWTTSSDVLRSNDLGHELRFWDCPTGAALQPSVCRDLPWASARVTLGYHCQGIYRSAADATSVNAADRSTSGDLLATVDDLGQVSLFRNLAAVNVVCSFVAVCAEMQVLPLHPEAGLFWAVSYTHLTLPTKRIV